MDETTDLPNPLRDALPVQPDRRTVLRRGAAVGALALWATPAVQTIAPPAFAAGTPPPGGGPTTGSLSGVVSRAADGSPIAGATVSGPGGATTTTGPDGGYSFASVPTGTQAFTASAAGFQPQTLTVAIAPGANTLNFALAAVAQQVVVTLSWQAVPRDLDLHMAGPRDGASDFHVYYRNRTSGPGNDVTLDVDDIDGHGPENQTIRTEPGSGGYVPGRYRVWVHNYSDQWVDDNSYAAGTATLTLTGPAGQVLSITEDDATGDPALFIWRGFEFTLDSAGTISGVTPLQRFEPGDESSTF